ncbi:hypothetical protein CP985_03200 [Malaciobacter mytili LMG 24559]|uniref:Uncharacterized protein n=2 Tax=Malaciobacter mytili TaxID=603050 RepID=A0AAX2AHJ3_9BACT|nr:hypothetical protein [Malaciobacter mytili]RXK16492.1 hypothetical protein CP985_03200 [Malaciobacter mytili LMG 24559]
MTYENLCDEINSDKTGLAKGYAIKFLQDMICYVRNSKNKFDDLINNDLKLFKSIEAEILERKKPQDGDFVEYSEGKFARISRIHQDGNIQLSNKIGVYVSEGGYSEASGCTYDSEIVDIERTRLVLKNLTPTSKTMIGCCWTFSEGISGANRGVNYNIKFKVWLLG